MYITTECNLLKNPVDKYVVPFPFYPETIVMHISFTSKVILLLKHTIT